MANINELISRSRARLSNTRDEDKDEGIGQLIQSRRAALSAVPAASTNKQTSLPTTEATGDWEARARSYNPSMGGPLEGWVSNALQSFGLDAAGSALKWAETAAQANRDRLYPLAKDIDAIRGTNLADATFRKTNDSPVQDSLGTKLLRMGQEAAERRDAGFSDKPIFNNALGISPQWVSSSIANAAENLALGLSAGPAALPVMAMRAGGNKISALTEQGVSADEALRRGSLTASIEAVTEKLPLDSLKAFSKTGGNVLSNLLTQGKSEAIEESLSYFGNLMADRAFKDPNAVFSGKELAQSALGGFLGGTVGGASATTIGNLSRAQISQIVDDSISRGQSMPSVKATQSSFRVPAMDVWQPTESAERQFDQRPYIVDTWSPSVEQKRMLEWASTNMTQEENDALIERTRNPQPQPQPIQISAANTASPEFNQRKIVEASIAKSKALYPGNDFSSVQSFDTRNTILAALERMKDSPYYAITNELVTEAMRRANIIPQEASSAFSPSRSDLTRLERQPIVLPADISYRPTDGIWSDRLRDSIPPSANAPQAPLQASRAAETGASVLSRLLSGESLSAAEIDSIPEVARAYADIGISEPTSKINTPERSALRTNVLTQLQNMGSAVDNNGQTTYNGNVAQGRRADIVIGLPAAGKSSVIVNPLSQQYQSRIIDSDMAKELLPEYNNGLGAGNVHEESKGIAKQWLDSSVVNGDNIVNPIVGSDLDGVMDRIKYLKNNGYSVYLHLNELPNAKATGRAIQRFIDTGRFVDPKIVQAYGDKPTQVYEAIRNMGGVIDGQYNLDTGESQRSLNAGAEETAAVRDAEGYVRQPGRYRRTPQTVRGTQTSAANAAGGLISGYSQYSNDVAKGTPAKVIEQSQDLSNPNTTEQIPVNAPAGGGGVSVPPVNAAYNNLIKKYGSIEQGEEPRARDIQVPKQSAPEQNVTQVIRTILESDAIPDSMVADVQQMIVDGDFSFESVTDKSVLDAASRMVKSKGAESQFNILEGKMDKGESFRKGDIAMLDTLLREYSQRVSNGDTAATSTVMKLLDMKANVGSDSGRNLQAQRMLKRMGPAGQLYGLKNTVTRINDQLLNKYGNRFPEITIDTTLAENLLKAQTEQDIDAAVDAIKQNIADQMPVDAWDKINAWRNLAMLGNPRTHIRNWGGNTLMAGMRRTKNIIGAFAESFAQANGLIDQSERTKSLMKSADSVRFAEQQFDANEGDITGQGKWSDESDIRSRRRIFDTRFIEWFRKFNFNMLEGADTKAMRKAYVDSFAQAMTARGLTSDFLNQNTKEARQAFDNLNRYAVNEALEATFRDPNLFADILSQIPRMAQQMSGSQTVGRLTEAGLNAVIPFKKTPANIVMRGLEYSPLNLARTIAQDTGKVKSGAITAQQYINSLSKGLTGTGAFVAGIILALNGIVTASKPEDTKESSFWRLEGKQAYAINIAGHSYTIDWAVPAVMPLIGGIELVDLWTERDDISWAAVPGLLKDSLFRMTDPVVELSFMQGLSNIAKTIAYNQGNVASALMESIPYNYAGQFVPTLSGQVARIVDPVRRDTYSYTNPESILSKGMQRFLNQQQAKIPGLSGNVMPSINQWGEVNKSGSLAERIFENTVSPGYLEKNSSDPVNAEIRRLYDATGEAAVLPAYSPAYVTVDKEKLNFNPQQYRQFSQTLGQTKYKLNSQIFSMPAYKSMSDTDKIATLSYVNSYANAMAKKEVLGIEPDGWIAKADRVARQGVTLPQQMAIRALMKEDGKEADKVKNIAKGIGVSQQQAQNLYNIMEKYKFSAADFTTDNQRSQMDYAKTTFKIGQADYIKMYNALIGVEGSKNARGETITGSKEREQRKVLQKLGYENTRINQFLQAMKYQSKK